MKKLLTLILILFIANTAANAAVLSADKIKKDVEAQIIKEYKSYTTADIEAMVMAVPFANITIPDGKLTYKITSTQQKFMSRDIKKIDILVDGKLIRSFNAPTQARAFKEVLVASDFIQREDAISEANTILKRMDVSEKLEYTFNTSLWRKDALTKKAFRQGEVIDKRFIKMKPDVQKLMPVTALFNTSGVLITIDAVALNDGMLGEYVNVENKKYKRIYTGKVIGENKVQIKM